MYTTCFYKGKGMRNQWRLIQRPTCNPWPDVSAVLRSVVTDYREWSKDRADDGLPCAVTFIDCRSSITDDKYAVKMNLRTA